MLPRLAKLPWIPSDLQWLELLELVREEPIRNRVMLALAYDAALRREELCSLRTDYLDPAHRTLRVRAETTSDAKTTAATCRSGLRRKRLNARTVNRDRRAARR